MSLKQITVNGLFWSFIDSFSNTSVQFVVGIILARLLSPAEFGVIGMVSIFIAVSQSFIDGGFSNALIQKKECTSADYSTVFFFNLSVSMLFYLLLAVSSGSISSFFKEPQLKSLIPVIGTGLIINAFGIIQRTILTKNINFKLQTRISVIASTTSGIFAIGTACAGFGIWSLVVLSLSRFTINSLFLWIWTQWRPSRAFSKQSFTGLFSFGSKMLLSGLIDSLFKNIYYMAIGKYFSAVELGYYTRADQFQSLPSQRLNDIISRVSFPVLSGLQDDKVRLKAGYQKLIRSTMFLTFVAMLGLVAVSKSLILTLIGEKWLPTVVYLQLLCLVGMFYPLHSLNLNILQIHGRSDLFLKLEIFKKILAAPVILCGIFWGIKVMIIGMILNAMIETFLDSYWSGKFVGYSFSRQIRDILPSFFLAAVISLMIWPISLITAFPPFWVLTLQLSGLIFLTIGICEFLKFQEYQNIRNIIVEKLKSRS